jgi:hypothetical protein
VQNSARKEAIYFIEKAIAFAPGFLSGNRIYLYLDTASNPSGHWLELDQDDLQKLDSMKLEYVFENQ